MDVAGMQVVLGADYDQLEKGFAVASQLVEKFKRDTLTMSKAQITANIEVTGRETLAKAKSDIQSLAILASKGIQLNASGIAQFEAALQALQSKTVDVKVNANGLDQVTRATDAIKDLQGKTVKIFADVTGIDKVLQASTAVNDLKDKTVKVATSVTGLNKVTQLDLALKALEQTATGGIMLDVKTGDVSQLLTTLREVKALSGGKTALQVNASGKGIEQLNAALQNTATYSTAAENALKSLQTAANTTLQFLAAQNASLATYLTTVAGVSAQATQNTAQLTQAVQATTQATTQAGTAAQGASQGFNAASASANTFISGNVDLNKSMIDNVQILNQYKARMREVSTQIAELAKMEGLSAAQEAANTQTIAQLGAEYATLKQQVSQATSTINAQAKANIAVEGSYNDLQQQLTLANQAFRRLSQTDREGSIGAASIKNIGLLSDKLKEIDAQMGIHVRNVGNYSSATTFLNQSFSQLSSEIPNFFQSARVGFQSISNNIGQVVAALQTFRAEQARAAAAGEPMQSSLKAVAGALINWQTLLFVGVGLLARYGGELVDWATGADKAKEAAEALKKEQEALQQIEKSATRSAGEQIGKLTALNAVITDSQAPLNKRKSAYDELQKIYPSYLKNISEDDALNGALADTINNKLVPAILAAAKARAYQDKINKLTADNIDLEEKQAKAVVESAKAMAKYSQAAKEADKNTQVFGGNSVAAFQTNYADKWAESARNAAQAAVDAQEALTKKIGENTDKINGYIKGMQVSISETGSLKIDGSDQAVNALKQTKTQTDAVTMSQNNLAAAIARVDEQLQSGQISALDAAKQKLRAYQSDLANLFKNKGDKVKIDADLSAINELQAGIKDLAASDVMQQFYDKLSVNAQLAAAKIGIAFDEAKGSIENISGVSETLEKVKLDLRAAEEAYKNLVSGKNALPLDDSKVIEVRNKIIDLINQVNDLTKQRTIDLAIKTAGNQELSIAEDLKNGWITPLEAAQQRVKNLEKELKTLQKAGADAGVIIPVKIDLSTAKQNSAVAEVHSIIENAERTFNQSSKSVDISVELGLVAPLDGLKEEISLKKRQINELLKALSKVDVTTVEGGAVGHLIQDSISHMIGDVNAAELSSQLQEKIQAIAVEGLAGVGEIIGGVLAGGDVGDLFGAMMQNIGGQLENLGKWMITTATKFAILKKTFEDALKVNPVLGIVAGIATVALGNAIKSAFQNKQSQMAFADGGIVYGRTNAILAEYQGARNNPEVVAPLNKLKNILQIEKGGTQQVEVVGVIDNDTIRLAVERSQKNSRK